MLSLISKRFEETNVREIKAKNKIAIFSERESEFKSKTFIPIEEVGLVLEKTATSKNLNAKHNLYLRNEIKTAWLPYSYTGDWSRNGYVISNQMKRTSSSKTDTPLVSFEFVNDKEIMSVSDADMNNILNWLKMNSEKRQTIKSEIKGKIMSYQNAYFESLTSIKEMNKTNNDSKAEIYKLRTRITVLITIIKGLEKEEEKLDVEEAAKSAIMNTNNEDIDRIIAKISILKKQIKKEDNSLNDLKPTDTKLLEQELKSALIKIQLPQFAPEKFLEEFSISKGKNSQTVKNTYKYCVPDITKFENCRRDLMDTLGLKKLRRSFF